MLRGRGRLRQHLRTHHQRRGAAVGRDAHLRRYVNRSARFSPDTWPLISVSGVSRSSFSPSLLSTTPPPFKAALLFLLPPPAFSYTFRREAPAVASPVSFPAQRSAAGFRVFWGGWTDRAASFGDVMKTWSRSPNPPRKPERCAASRQHSVEWELALGFYFGE